MSEKVTEKARIHFYIEKNILKQCDAALPLAKCTSRNEFVNKAIEFFLFYLHTENDTDLLCKTMNSIVSATIKNTENRLSRLQFKEAVELAKITRMIAPLCGLDSRQLEKLHIDCVNEVKRINGIIDYQSAVEVYRKEEPN